MRKNKIYIKSYGCQMNVYDSNRILDLFKNQNYEIAEDPKDANLVVLNTCHIREKAAEKVYSDIGRINKLKKDISKENFKLVVAGAPDAEPATLAQDLINPCCRLVVAVPSPCIVT